MTLVIGVGNMKIINDNHDDVNVNEDHSHNDNT